MESIMCPAGCGRIFLTSQARESHLTQSQNCAWWRKYQKSAQWKEELEAAAEIEALGPKYMARLEEEEEEEKERVGNLLQEYEEDHNIFHFVPLEEPEQPKIGEAGPGPNTQANRLLEKLLGAKARTLDDNSGEDAQILEWNETAGVIIATEPSLQERWKLAHNLEAEVPMDGTSPLPNTIYAPFSSEMDWRIAEWVIKDGIGHKSFDRLLAIPGVSCPMTCFSTFTDYFLGCGKIRTVL
jgi:hypothetical protein